MEEITIKEVREIAEKIVNKVNECSNDYDAVDDAFSVLKEIFINMNITIKENTDCKCTKCSCIK